MEFHASFRFLLLAAAVWLAACAPRASAPAAPPAAPPPPVAPTARPLVPAPPWAESASARELRPGVTYRFFGGSAGPWAVHLVEAELGRCELRLEAVKAGGGPLGREATSELAAGAAADGVEPVAAVNADFFRFQPPGLTAGAHLEGGEIVSGPTARPVFGVIDTGAPFIATLSLHGFAAFADEGFFPLARINSPPPLDSLALYTGFGSQPTPADTGAVELRLRLVAAAGDTLVGIAASFDTLPGGVAAAPAEPVLAARGRAAAWLRGIAPGDTIRWWYTVRGALGKPIEVVGGFPVLLAGGDDVLPLAQGVRPAFGEERHPRTAVGWRADGTLLLVVVDGRQPGYSTGMSLAELSSLMRSLGATDALNLDGGGSTTMVIDGAVANRPSDAEGERPVANALVLVEDPANCNPADLP